MEELTPDEITHLRHVLLFDALRRKDRIKTEMSNADEKVIEDELDKLLLTVSIMNKIA